MKFKLRVRQVEYYELEIEADDVKQAKHIMPDELYRLREAGKLGVHEADLKIMRVEGDGSIAKRDHESDIKNVYTLTVWNSNNHIVCRNIDELLASVRDELDGTMRPGDGYDQVELLFGMKSISTAELERLPDFEGF